MTITRCIIILARGLRKFSYRVSFLFFPFCLPNYQENVFIPCSKLVVSTHHQWHSLVTLIRVAVLAVSFVISLFWLIVVVALLCFCVATEFSVNKDLYIVIDLLCFPPEHLPPLLHPRLFGGNKQWCDQSVCPSARLSHAPGWKRCILGPRLLQNTIANSTPKVEPTGQCGRIGHRFATLVVRIRA